MPRGPRAPYTAAAASLAEQGADSAAIVAALERDYPHVPRDHARVIASQARRKAGLMRADPDKHGGLIVSERTRRYFADRGPSFETNGPQLMARVLAIVARDDMIDAIIDDDEGAS